MKKIFQLSVLAFVFAFVPTTSFALRAIAVPTKKEAKEMGIEVRATPAGPDAAWVELELKAEGKLKEFSHVELQIYEGEKLLIAYAGMREERLNGGKIIVRFMVNRVYLEEVSLCVVAGLDTGYDLNLKNFVEVDKLR